MLGENKMNLQHVHGWWMPADESHLPDHMAALNQPVAGRLTYQLAKYNAARMYVKNFSQAVDVGGYIGLWSWVMARDFDAVMAFEPMELHRECWRRNMEGIDHAGLYECALGAEKGRVALECRTPGSSGDTQVRPGAKGTTPMETLDSFNFADVGLIKVDCEGYEEFVLRGAVETLERCKPVVIVEQKRDMSRRYGLGKQSAVSFLQRMGAVMRREISGDFILSWDS